MLARVVELGVREERARADAGVHRVVIDTNTPAAAFDRAYAIGDAAAISGDSTLLVQGTAGTDESALRYGWNYARLLAEGPSEAALVPSPVYRAMRAGSIVRVCG